MSGWLWDGLGSVSGWPTSVHGQRVAGRATGPLGRLSAQGTSVVTVPPP